MPFTAEYMRKHAFISQHIEAWKMAAILQTTPKYIPTCPINNIPILV